MTQAKFIELCEAHAIAPSVALESDDLREALAARDDATVERILNEEF